MSSITTCPNCGKRNRLPAAAKGTPRCAQCHHALAWTVDADDATFATVVDDATVPVLIDLWAPWCGPCRMVSPALETLARENAGSLKLVKVNVDHSPAVAQRFDARSIPTLVVLRDGKVLARQVGAAPEHALRKWLEGALGSSS